MRRRLLMRRFIRHDTLRKLPLVVGNRVGLRGQRHRRCWPTSRSTSATGSTSWRSVFRDEPAGVGNLNALALSVEEYATGGTEPVNDWRRPSPPKSAKTGRR